MSKHDSGGYRGAGLKLLSKHGVSTGETVRVVTVDGEITGVLMPRYESASEDYVVIKLKSGYNTGIHVGRIKLLAKLPKGESTPARKAQQIVANKGLPRIALISTGGTIASKIDYRTGGVHAALSASELYASVPELASHASIDPEVLLSEYSENLKPEHWTMIANKVAERVKSSKYRGIVVSHGTDTMHYTAAALSFALQGIPIPVVLVGAQRSSDRPSSDAALNLLGATVFAAKSDFAGVFVAMHASTSDGSSQTRLTSNGDADTEPCWSPDGSQIVFHSFRDGNEEIYKMNADGTGQTRLTNNLTVDRSPDWGTEPDSP